MHDDARDRRHPPAGWHRDVDRYRGLVAEPNDLGRRVVTENRVPASAQHRRPEHVATGQRAVVYDIDRVVHALPAVDEPGLDRLVGQPARQGLPAGQHSTLVLGYLLQHVPEDARRRERGAPSTASLWIT